MHVFIFRFNQITPRHTTTCTYDQQIRAICVYLKKYTYIVPNTPITVRRGIRVVIFSKNIIHEQYEIPTPVIIFLTSCTFSTTYSI